MTRRWLTPREVAEYLNSAEFTHKRKACFRRFASRCALCGSRDNLEVHHRTYENFGDEKPEDLTLLCHDCHALFHASVPMWRQPYLPLEGTSPHAQPLPESA
jgi:hypothetical protein